VPLPLLQSPQSLSTWRMSPAHGGRLDRAGFHALDQQLKGSANEPGCFDAACRLRGESIPDHAVGVYDRSPWDAAQRCCPEPSFPNQFAPRPYPWPQAGMAGGATPKGNGGGLRCHEVAEKRHLRIRPGGSPACLRHQSGTDVARVQAVVMDGEEERPSWSLATPDAEADAIPAGPALKDC